MERSLSQLESIIRNRICNVCTARTVDAECGLEEPARCALFRLFPQVTHAIQSVQGDDVHRYIEAIRRDVCAVCADQAADGSCETRRNVQCPLDAYLLPVVDAFEEATGRTFSRRGLGPVGTRVRRRSGSSIQP